MRRIEAGDEFYIPTDGEKMVRGLQRIGVCAHKGKSGRKFKVGDEVHSWRDKFAGGVTRKSGLFGLKKIKPKPNRGGYPSIETKDGDEMIVAATIHTHEKTDFVADGVPVETRGFKDLEEADQFDDVFFGS